MYQSIPSLTISPGKTPWQFFDGRIPTPGQKEFKTPTSPRAYKNEQKPPLPGAFSSIIHNKNMKKWDKSCT